MSPNVALRILRARKPCEHPNADYSHPGRTDWMDCPDCGAVFDQDEADFIRTEARQYEEALRTLEALVQQLA